MAVTLKKISTNPKEPDQHPLHNEAELEGFGLASSIFVRRSHVLLGIAIAFVSGVMLGGYLVGYVLMRVVGH